MKVLLIGGGGREHALAEVLARSAQLTELIASPGNPGIAQFARVVPSPQDPRSLADLAEREGVALTIVGPEAPLVVGIADEFAARGLALFGPSRAAARIEGDKAWAKAFMTRHGVATAAYASFTDLDSALAYAKDQRAPMVVKDAGLRAGKGVTICEDHASAEQALRDVFSQPEASVVIEEFMTGQEVTVLAFTDGTTSVLMPPAQDHKTIHEGDRGPMTGGMGVISPYPLSAQQLEAVQRDIIQPTLLGLRAEGCPFVGVLYAGLMLTPDGPKVVEFNCRFGDPEAEAVLPLLDSDFLTIAQACVAGRLTPDVVRFRDEASAVIVMAAPNYPGAPQTGIPLKLPEERAGERVYHAGTAEQGGTLVSSGGRVLAVQAEGATLEAALTKAYALVDRVGFPGAQVRRDIGFRVGLVQAREAR